MMWSTDILKNCLNPCAGCVAFAQESVNIQLSFEIKTVKQTFQNDKKHKKGSSQLPNVCFIFFPGVNALANFQFML